MIEAIQQGISNEAYHTGRGLSKSGMSELLKSPERFKHRYIDRKTFSEPTPAMIFGSALHTMVLEPQLFHSQYVIDPKMPKRSNADKELWAKFQADNAGKQIISQDDFDAIQAMSRAVSDNGHALGILSQEGQAELSIFAEISGVLCKCRPDWLTNIGLIADLKSAEDASYDAFSRACFVYGYHIQVALYTDVCRATGLPIDAFSFIVVEKKPPHSVAVYSASARMVDLGRAQYLQAIETYKRCQETGYWPGYNNDSLVEIDLPKWAENIIGGCYGRT